MRKQAKQGRMDGLFVLLLFGVFACCVLIVLLTGARSYRRVSERDNAAYDRRICTAYIAAKLRAADALEQIYVGSFDGLAAARGDTLHLREEIEGEAYETRIYYYDGAVRELFAAAGEEFSPEDGNEVLPAQALSFSLEDGLLTVETANAAGDVSALTLLLRSGEGAAS